MKADESCETYPKYVMVMFHQNKNVFARIENEGY